MKPERVFQVCRHGLTQGLPCSVLAGKELIGGDEVDGTEVDTDPVCERMAGDGVVRPCLLWAQSETLGDCVKILIFAS